MNTSKKRRHCFKIRLSLQSTLCDITPETPLILDNILNAITFIKPVKLKLDYYRPNAVIKALAKSVLILIFSVISMFQVFINGQHFDLHMAFYG